MTDEQDGAGPVMPDWPRIDEARRNAPGYLPPLTDEDGAITPFDISDCQGDCARRHMFWPASQFDCMEMCDRAFVDEAALAGDAAPGVGEARE